MENKEKGLIIVNTGNGKGKTTAALGLVLRSFGNGFKVLILQFIKGAWKYGEIEGIKKLGDNIILKQCGLGFSRKDKNQEKHIAAAQKTIEEVREAIFSCEYDLIVLDEILYAINFGLIKEDEVIEILKNKPEKLHLVLTGRGASEKIIEVADLVTEMKEIKNPFKKGIKAQKGIEF